MAEDVRTLPARGSRLRVFAVIGIVIAVVFVGVTYEYEQAPRLTGTSCRWLGNSVGISGEIHNPSVFNRSYVVVPRVVLAGGRYIGGLNHLSVSVSAGATDGWGAATGAPGIASDTPIRVCRASASATRPHF
jgi:hypothetical protein